MLRRLSKPSLGIQRYAFRMLSSHSSELSAPLSEIDPEVNEIVRNESRRQKESITLIPSENFTSNAVLEALGSIMQNKYSEGYPGARYYGGNEFIDKAERLCQQRALETFKLDPEVWGVNVQPLSGSPANFYVYTALLQPHDRMMSLDLPHGGHLSHGYQTPSRKVSAVSKYFEVLPYRLDESSGLIDYANLDHLAHLYRPKLIVTGASSYPRLIDTHTIRSTADSVNSILLYDMAHISGLVAAGVVPSPFDHADIVTTTTHKSLRGPRGAMIFYKKEYADAINASVFPGHQGGPHNHTITALAVALKQAQSADFKEYQRQVLANSKQLATSLQDLGFELVSGGTDNHLMLIDLRPRQIDGGKVEKVLEAVSIAANKNTVPGDKSAMVPGGLRVGTPAVTTRGMKEVDMKTIASFIARGTDIAYNVLQKSPSRKLKDFINVFDAEHSEVLELKQSVQEFARKFNL